MSTQISETPTTSSVKKRLIITMLGLSVVSGVIGYGVLKLPSAKVYLEWGLGLIFCCLIFLWLSEDMLIRELEASLLARIFIVGLAIVAVPIYFLKTRGLWGGFKATALAGMFLLVCLLAQYVITISLLMLDGFL